MNKGLPFGSPFLSLGEGKLLSVAHMIERIIRTYSATDETKVLSV